MQTGVQLLSGFLLTLPLPLQQRFSGLGASAQTIYLVKVSCSVLATVVLIAPVAVHRVLLRRHGPRGLVPAAHRMADVGVALVTYAVVGVVLRVLAVVKGSTVGITAGSLTAATVVVLWVPLPLGMLRYTATARVDDGTVSG